MFSSFSLGLAVTVTLYLNSSFPFIIVIMHYSQHFIVYDFHSVRRFDWCNLLLWEMQRWIVALAACNKNSSIIEMVERNRHAVRHRATQIECGLKTTLFELLQVNNFGQFRLTHTSFKMVGTSFSVLDQHSMCNRWIFIVSTNDMRRSDFAHSSWNKIFIVVWTT